MLSVLNAINLGIKFSLQNPTQQEENKMLELQMKKKNTNFFIATYFLSNVSSESKLINRACTNHMTHNKEI